MNNNADRIYHPVSKWEEMQYNMWGDVKDKAESLQKAIIFTGDHALYGQYMRRVANEWPFSCENALTDKSINKRAWLGHAACALAMNIPENIIREAWGYLSDQQRMLADREAEEAIAEWRRSRENKSISGEVGKQMLLRWDT